MEQISISYRLVATVMWFVCLGFSVVICSEPSEAMIKTYVTSSSLPSNDDLVDSAMLKVVQRITEFEWDSLVVESRLPVMVLFTDERCGPHCERLHNIMEYLDSYYNDKFKFYRANIDEEQLIASSYGVTTTPTTIVFKGGYEMERVEGFYPGKLDQLVHKYV